ncbi:MAG: LysR family transcriptional regulator [Burkholderiaceae bacterium]
MAHRDEFDKIELHLVRVLHTVISERSVSRAALRLASSQPAVSAQLRRLRALTGDPLLVRAGAGMAPTETALALLQPAADLLHQAERLFAGHAPTRAFDAAAADAVFRIAASDYLDPLFLPALVARLKERSPQAQVQFVPLSGDFDYRRSLAAGDVDLVIGNWLEPPAELHLGRLLVDDVVCLVGEQHPAVRSRDWSVARYLACDHVAPSQLHPGAVGVIDQHLAARGLARTISVRSAHFGLIPLMVAQSLLVLTTGRQFCSRYVDALPLRIVRCPVDFPPLVYYQLWHDLTHRSPAQRWLREQVREVALEIGASAPPQRGRRARR